MLDGQLMDWELSSSASKCTEKAASKAKTWIDLYDPDLIVTEKLTPHSRKRGQVIRNIAAIEDAIRSLNRNHTTVERIQRHSNKYDEIAALVKLYPVIANWAPPKRRIWEGEPKNTVLFEALSLVEQAK